MNVIDQWLQEDIDEKEHSKNIHEGSTNKVVGFMLLINAAILGRIGVNILVDRIRKKQFLSDLYKDCKKRYNLPSFGVVPSIEVVECVISKLKSYRSKIETSSSTTKGLSKNESKRLINLFDKYIDEETKRLEKIRG